MSSHNASQEQTSAHLDDVSGPDVDNLFTLGPSAAPTVVMPNLHEQKPLQPEQKLAIAVLAEAVDAALDGALGAHRWLIEESNEIRDLWLEVADIKLDFLQDVYQLAKNKL